MVSLNDGSSNAEFSDKELNDFVSVSFPPPTNSYSSVNLTYEGFGFSVSRHPGWVDHMLKMHPNQ